MSHSKKVLVFSFLFFILFSIILVNETTANEATINAQFSFTESSEIAFGEKIQVDISSPNGVSWVRYNWDITDNNWNTNLIEVNPTQTEYHLEIDTPKKLGVHTLTIMARDNQGNDSVWYSINYLITDKVKPVISLKGDSTVVLNTGTFYKDPGFTAIDNYDGNISRRVLVKSTLNTLKAGTYKIEYSTIDSAGNDSEIVTRTIKVNSTVATNSMKLVGNEFVALNVGDTYVEQGAIVTDIRNNKSNASIDGFVDTTKVGTYNLVYSTDKPINPMTRTVVVNKGTYDLSNITFGSKTVVYDGSLQSLAISGTLPNGVSVEYIGNYINMVGTYVVTAKFSGDFVNYNSIPDKTATITINPVPAPVIEPEIVLPEPDPIPKPEPEPTEPVDPPVDPIDPKPPVEPEEKLKVKLIGDYSHTTNDIPRFFGDVTIKFNKGTAVLYKNGNLSNPITVNSGDTISGWGDYKLVVTYVDKDGNVTTKVRRFHIRLKDRRDDHWLER